MVAHAGVPGLQGGFVGVDLFFVISGFLITRLLVQELRRASCIDLWHFYARRVRRLLPAFAAMIVAVAIATTLLLPASDWQFQARASAWAAVWVSNVFFAGADVDYFGPQRENSVLLHTWSLGVEEQFYLVWPVLLWLEWRWLGSRLARLIALLASAGFLLAWIATHLMPIDAYYLLPFRLWQLAAGGAAWFAAARMPSRGIGATLGPIGGIMLLVSATALSPASTYPGIWALLPTIGAMAVLVAGAGAHRDPMRRLLETSPLTWTGRISYSWYLWHWPVLVLGAAWARQEPLRVTGLVALSLVLAALSYACIERPTRALPIRRARLWVLCGIASAVALAAAMFVWHRIAQASIEDAAKGVQADFEHRVLSTTAKPLLYRDPRCDQWYLSAELVPCRFGPPAAASAPLAIVIGDSVTLQWFPAMQATFAQAGWNFVVLTKSSCPMVDRSFHYDRLRRDYLECDEWRRKAIDYVRVQRPAMLLMGSADRYPFSEQEWRDGTRDLLRQLHDRVGQVVILPATPVLPFLAPTCVVQQDAASSEAMLERACTVPLASVENRAHVATLQAASEGLPNVTVLDLNNLVCPNGLCQSWRDAQLVFRDDRHLNALFVERIASEVARRLQPLMQRSGPPREAVQPD